MRQILFFCLLLSAAAAQPTDTLIARMRKLPDGNARLYLSVRLASRLRNNFPDSAMQYLQNGIAANRQVAKDTLGIAHNELGLVYEDKGRPEEAEKEFLQAINLFTEANNEFWLSKAYNNLGSIYRTRGDLETALNYYLKSLEIKERLNDDSRASPLNNIGLTFMMQEKYAKSIEYYLMAVQIYEKNGDSSKLIVAYNNIGEGYNRLEDYSNSMGYFLRAMKISKQRKDLTGLSLSYESIARVYLRKEEYDKALEYCELGIDLCQQLGRITKLIELNNTRAEILIHKRKYEMALPILTLNLQQENELQVKEYKLRTLELLQQAHKGLLHHREAKEYEKMYAALKREIQDAAREQRMNQLESDFRNKPKNAN